MSATKRLNERVSRLILKALQRDLGDSFWTRSAQDEKLRVVGVSVQGSTVEVTLRPYGELKRIYHGSD
jgi:hypothetical protein